MIMDQPPRLEFEQAANMQVDSEAVEIVQDGFFAELAQQAACSVRVALRVRPLMGREIYDNAKICVECNQETSEITIGKDRNFTFDKAYGIHSTQQSVFQYCVKNLVLGCFAGFNATVLAYGQTGSGKTYTMGSGYALGVQEENLGIIPRVIRLIFSEIERRRSKAEIIVKCAFLEIYNEELIDLLDHDKLIPVKKDINIREEKNGTISVFGLKEVTVKSAAEMANCLDIGSNARSTASTLMNQQSSRSHAIFTITIEQHLIEDDPVAQQKELKTDEFMVAKFHFVDLAGSERAKKTGATGSVLKEGININKSLLALGNVIAALTGEDNKIKHVPYRDSKLTRILQDSLGGNSRTSMIACCSPAESNYEETLNTLKYASRARNIENKPIINRDPASQQIVELRLQVYELQKELLGSRKLLMANNIQFESHVVISEETLLTSNMNQIVGGTMLHGDTANTQLHQKLSQKEKQISTLDYKISQLEDQSGQLKISSFEISKERDYYKVMAEQMSVKLRQMGVTVDMTQATSVLEDYQTRLAAQNKELADIRVQLRQLQNDNQNLLEQAQRDTHGLEVRQAELEKLKRQIALQQKEQEGPSPAKNNLARRGTVQVQSRPLDNNQAWMSTDLDHKIKHFDEIRQMFMEDFGNQISQIADTKPKASINENVEMQSQSDESDEQLLSDDDINFEIPNDQQVELEQVKLQEQQAVVIQLADQVKDKEALLAAFKESQKELQQSLLSAMKEEYHNRVAQLNEEILRLDAEKKIALDKAQGANKTKLEDTFKKKQQELEIQVNALKLKDREAQQKQKLFEQHKQKVKQLELDLERMKTQKVTMMKKVRDDQEKLSQYKKDRAKELLTLKANLSKKERENALLAREAKKKEILAKRKQEEIASLQQRQKLDQQKKQSAQVQRQNAKGVIDEAKIRDWIIQNTNRFLNYREIQKLRKQKEIEFKEIDSDINEQQALFAKQSIAHEKMEQTSYARYLADNEDVDAEEIQRELQVQRNQMAMTKELIESLESRQTFINDQIVDCNRQLAEIKPESLESKIFSDVQTLEGARVCINNFFLILLDVHLEANQIQKELDFKTSEIQSFSAEYHEFVQKSESQNMYLENQLQELKDTHEKREQLWTNIICEKVGVDANEFGSDIDLKILFQLCSDRAGKTVSSATEREIQIQNSKNEGLRNAVNAQIASREVKKENVNQAKVYLAKQVTELQQQLKQSDMQVQRLTNDNIQANKDKMKYKKNYEDLLAKTKKNIVLSNATPDPVIAQQLNIKNETVNKIVQPAPNYKDARNARKMQQKQEQDHSNVDDMAGDIADLNSNTPNDKISPRKEMIEASNYKKRHSQLIPELKKGDSSGTDDVFQRLNQGIKKSGSFKQLQSNQIKEVMADEVQFTIVSTEEDQWRMTVEKLEAHKSQIYAMTSHSNFLFSSAAKSLKIWDLNTMQYISDLPEKIGLVKCMQYWEEKGLLLTASEKTVTMWSVVDLTIAGTIKTNLKDEIKCMELVGSKLFLGTKGTANSNGLLIYDLKGKNSSVYEERAKDQDIFSLKATGSHIYLGCRNHYVYPVDLKTLSMMSPLTPPHFDAVTALALMGSQTLVSGSKDKNLRSYRVDSTGPNFEHQNSQMNAHTDQINALDTDFSGRQLFSGSKDGIVKVWRQSEGTYGDLVCKAKLEGNASDSSVNAICKIETKSGSAFACGSSDKSIRIWAQPQKEVDSDLHERSEVSCELLNLSGSALTQLRMHKQKKQQQQ